MRVLITNNTLAERAGTELYVRDLARSLLARGHTPMCYSSRLGAVAEELRRATIPVVDDIAELPFQPDIIHGQHHLDAMAALLSLPGVPAIYFCHGWMPWEEMAPKFPRILRYVAVDEVCRERLLIEQKIPESQVRLMLNFVDLKRFLPREPLPSKPKTAMVFSNYAMETTYIAAVRAACTRFKIKLDVVGSNNGTATDAPEKILAGYDLVFAKARSALEAMAVGCAVVLCDAVGCGPLVLPENFDRLRPLNFGVRTLSQPVTEENLAAEIARYNSASVAPVQARVRAEADLEHTTDKLVKLYEEVVAEFRKMPPSDALTEFRATGAYLQSLSPIAKRALNAVTVVQVPVAPPPPPPAPRKPAPPPFAVPQPLTPRKR